VPTCRAITVPVTPADRATARKHTVARRSSMCFALAIFVDVPGYLNSGLL